jgi:vacuolar-type H+-ATPase subunit E/Vma4
VGGVADVNLDAVRAALIADARTDASSLLAAADHDADNSMARSHEEAAQLREAARTEGAREAAERVARLHATTRREAREVVLTARRQALDDLRERARTAARALALEDQYGELRERLRSLAVFQLGPDAEILDDPDGEPGVVARDGHRRVDYRLVTLADRAVDALGADVATLWD